MEFKAYNFVFLVFYYFIIIYLPDSMLVERENVMNKEI
jgi:hypothetical protein